MSEQIVDNITGLLVVALIFFTFINILMFASMDEYWSWGDLITIIVIDALFILLVCIGIWAIANL